jgi:DNA replication protein DnaC
MPTPMPCPLRSKLTALNLPFMREHYQPLAKTAADKHWSHLDYFTELVNGEAAAREDRRVQRCIQLARFPVLKTLDTFDWNWPTKINRLQIQNLFHLDFVAKHANVVFISTTGLGKSHSDDRAGLMPPASAGTPCCSPAPSTSSTRWPPRTPAAASSAPGTTTSNPRSCASTSLGYLPIDKFGADCLFQIISHRYERGATLITTNRPYKQWAGIFNNDATLTSALLDRLLDHAETVRDRGQELPRAGPRRKLKSAAPAAPAPSSRQRCCKPISILKPAKTQHVRAGAHTV